MRRFLLERLNMPGGRGIFYGWFLVGLSGFTMVLATVPLFHAMASWAVALKYQFHWSETQLGWAFTLTRIEGGLMGPAEGYLTDKIGTRRMVFIGLCILGGAFIFFGQIQNLWMFYLAYILMAVGQGLGSWIPLMTMLNRWFVRRRASAIGWSNVGSRAGALLLIPAIGWAVDPGYDRLGWSMTATILGIVILVAAGPIALLLRNDPQSYGLLPDGDSPGTDPSQSAHPAQESARPQQSDLTAAQAVRTPAFWLIALGHGFTSMVILAIMTYLGLMMVEKGFQLLNASLVITVYTAVAMAFQLVGGYVGDRVPKRLALSFFTMLQAGGVLVLVFADTLLLFYLFAVLFGMGFGGRNPLTVAIRADYFGTASFGKILGLSTVPMNALLLIAAPFTGWMYVTQGTYANAFLILAGLNVLGALCFLAARRPQVPGPQVSPIPQTAD